MPTQPLISVILATYNGHHDRLSQSIESVLGQSYKNLEFIIINDASTNDIEKTILKYVNHDKRISYIKNEKNLKLTKTLNKGIELAQGKYIARIDDDDIRCDPDKLQKQVDFMEAHPDYGLCGTGVITINQQGEIQDQLPIRKSDDAIRERILQYNPIAHASIVVRKDIVQQLGGYNENYIIIQDYDLWSKIGRLTKLCNLDFYGIKYRINTQSISHANISKVKREFLSISWNNRKYYPHPYLALCVRILDFVLPLRTMKRLARQYTIMRSHLFTIFSNKRS